jgi:hypothetical protein
MSNLLGINSSQLKSIYNTLYINNKQKDKLDMILEPLQAMIQLSLLSVSPIGTKLTIQENILYLQHPGFIQPFSRWYNSDKKDDLYYLFQVIRRFIKWYNPNNSRDSPIGIDLYTLIVRMATKGLDNILSTYNSVEGTTVVQVVNMYRNILQNIDTSDVDKLFSEKGLDVDKILVDVIKIYDQAIIGLVFNLLSMIERENDETNNENYIQALNLIMTNSNKLIQSWIRVHLVF